MITSSPRIGSQLSWTCRFCGTRAVRDEHCPNCGAARSEQSAAALPGQTEVVSISDLFVLNPANRDFLTGKSRKLRSSLSTLSSGCMFVFLTPFVVVGVAVLIAAVSGWVTYLQLTRADVSVQAEVIDQRTSSDSDGDSYYVTYRFYANDKPYVYEQSVNYDTYSTLSKGARVSVTYARSNPGVSRLSGDPDLNTSVFLTLFSVFWNLFVFGVVIAVVRQSRRFRRLEREGRLLKGVVVSCNGHQGEDYTVLLRYAFRTPQNHEIVKRESYARDDLKGARLPQQGVPVVVIYADDHCYMVL